MKKISLFFMLVLCVSLFATTYNTPIIDGTISTTSDWDANENMGAPSGNNPSWDMWVTWDANYLYLGWNVAAVFPSGNDGISSYLDTQVGGTTSGIYSATLGLSADICIEVTQNAASSGYYIYNSGWGTLTNFSTNDFKFTNNNGQNNDVVELRIAWSTLPNGSSSPFEFDLLTVVEDGTGAASAAWPDSNTDLANSTYTFAWNDSGGTGFDPSADSIVMEYPPDGPLPVTLSSFTAIFANDMATLNWLTQSETNNMGWNIYRSTSDDFAGSFRVNDVLIEGAGTTSEITEYSFSDESVDLSVDSYYYWLESVELSGATDLFGPLIVEIPIESDNPNPPAITENYGLFPNYPNPFNPSTSLAFRLKNSSFGNFSIYNLKGEKIATIFTGNIAADEIIRVNWNGKNSSGKIVTSGFYFAKLVTRDKTYNRRIMLLK